VAINLQAFKVALGELLSSSKEDNFVQAVENALNNIGDTSQMGWATGQIVHLDQLKQSGAAVGQVPAWNGSVYSPATPATTSSPPFVTALPVGPADGDECVYEADATNRIYWHLKHKTSVSKWVKIGGPPLYAEVETSELTTSTSYADLATAGPSLTAPLAGDYTVGWVFDTSNSSTFFCRATPKIGSAAGSDADSAISEGEPDDLNTVTGFRKKTLAASDVVKLQYRVENGTGTFVRRRLTIDPVYVS
jgi:hypothetical protein